MSVYLSNHDHAMPTARREASEIVNSIKTFIKSIKFYYFKNKGTITY